MRIGIASLRRDGCGRSPLLTWHWLLALVVLVVNDHALKGSGLLPSWSTGKLSDFAGLYAAPLLVAVVLRGGIRSWRVASDDRVERALLPFSALLTAACFASLQLSAEVEQVAEVATALLGVSWEVTRDVTDLMALPMAGLAAWSFAPWFGARTCTRAPISLPTRGSAPKNRPIEGEGVFRGPIGSHLLAARCPRYLICRGNQPDCRSRCAESSTAPQTQKVVEQLATTPRSAKSVAAERLLAAAGLLACIATSREPTGRWQGTFWSEAPVVVNSSLELSVELRLHRLAEDVQLDCAGVAEAPGERIPRGAFQAQERWLLDPGGSLILDRFIAGAGACGAVIVQLEGVAPQLVFWSFGELPGREVPTVWDSASVDDDGVVWVRFDAEGKARDFDDVGRGWLHRLGAAPARECPALQASSDLWWLELSDLSNFQVNERRETADGCVRLRLTPALPQLLPRGELPGLADALHTAGLAMETPDGDAAANDAAAAPLDAGAAEDTSLDVGLDGGATAPLRDAGGSLGTMSDAGASRATDAGFTPSANQDAGVEATGSGVAVTAQDIDLTLCVPPEHVPFGVGNELQIAERDSMLRLSTPDGSWRLQVFQRLTSQLSLAPFELEPVPDDSCEFASSDEPLSTRRGAGLAVNSPWGRATLGVGEQESFDALGLSFVVGLTAATQNLVTNGPDAAPLGFVYSGFVLEEN